MERLEYCFSRIKDKYLPEGRGIFFNHRNTDHYAMFLYFVSNSVFRMDGDPALAEKAYALNKALHALEIFYEAQLPQIFFFAHPVGTVLGRARYADYFAVYQRCTVGGNDGVYPTIGEGVIMFGGSSIIGNCRVGANIWLSADTLVMGQDIPDSSVVFGQSPKLTIKPTKRSVRAHHFSRTAPS